MTDFDNPPATFPMLQRARQVLKLMRLRPFDGSTPQGRSAERHRRIALSGLSAAAAKFVNVAVMFITVRVTIGYLGEERYGLWMAISSMVSMLAFADFGLSNGLLTALSEDDGRNDREAAANHVSSAFFMLFGIALTLALIFAALYAFVPWPRVVNAKGPEAIAEAGVACAVFFGFFLLNLPISVVSRIQGGYQESYVANFWSTIGSLLMLGGVFVCVHLRAGLPSLIGVLMGAPLLALLISAIPLFGWRRPWLLPHLSRFSLRNARDMFNIGLLFFVLQICVSMAFFADNVVLAQVIGLQAVTQYAIPMRLFVIPTMICMLFSGALWPAYGEAFSRGDVAWVKRMLGRSVWMTIALTAPASVVLVIFHRPLLLWWVKEDLHPSMLLIAGLAVWTVMGTMGQTLAMFLNGLRIIGFQVFSAVTMAVTNLILSILLARRIGVPGVIWGTNIAYFIFSIIPYAIYIPWKLKRLEHELPSIKPSNP